MAERADSFRSRLSAWTRSRLVRLVEAAAQSKVVALALFVGLALDLRLAVVQLSTVGWPIHIFEGHNWRQSFTYGVAWNFAHGPIDPLRPRMYAELATSNVVAMEPPLHPLLSSVLLRLTGDSVVGLRLLSWLSLVAIVAILFHWLGDSRSSSNASRGLSGWAERAGLFIAIALPPAVVVEFRSIQPEPLAAALVLGAAFFLVRYRDRERHRDAAIGIVLAALAVYVKPVALGVLPAHVLFAMWGPGRFVRRGLVVGIGIGLLLAPYVAWDAWAQHLKATELHGQIFIAIEHDTKEMLANLRKAEFQREALIHLLPDYAGSWWLLPAYVAGLYRGLADRRLRSLTVPFLVWLGGYMFELLAVGDRLESNAYYFILGPAPLAFFGALGLGAMVRCLDASDRRPARSVYISGLIATIFLPTAAFFAHSSTWASTEVAALGFERNRYVWAGDLGLGRMVVGLVVVFALLPYLRPRKVPEWLGLTLLVTILGTGVYAARDVMQYFRFYVAADRRVRFDSELADLRAAIDAQAAPDERIVISPGGTTRAPSLVLFYYARRNGFAAAEDSPPDFLDRVHRRGVRLLLRYDPPGANRVAVPGSVIAQGPWWRLSCIAPEGCVGRRAQ